MREPQHGRRPAAGAVTPPTEAAAPPPPLVLPAGAEAEIARNQRLAATIANGRDACPLDDVIHYAFASGTAGLDFPGPRAAQLAKALVDARAELDELRAIRQRAVDMAGHGAAPRMYHDAARYILTGDPDA